MKTIWCEGVVGCLVAAMAACSPTGGPDGASGRDAGGSQASSTDAGTCTSAQVAILGPACATCVESNCHSLMASCAGGSCAQCLLGCTTCASACLGGVLSADAGESAGRGDSGMPSGSGGDGGTPSCDLMRQGNCCSYAALVNLEAQCQQALDSDSEAICSSLMSQTRNFLGFCK